MCDSCAIITIKNKLFHHFTTRWRWNISCVKPCFEAETLAVKLCSFKYLWRETTFLYKPSETIYNAETIEIYLFTSRIFNLSIEWYYDEKVNDLLSFLDLHWRSTYSWWELLLKWLSTCCFKYFSFKHFVLVRGKQSFEISSYVQFMSKSVFLSSASTPF